MEPSKSSISVSLTTLRLPCLRSSTNSIFSRRGSALSSELSHFVQLLGFKPERAKVSDFKTLDAVVDQLETAIGEQVPVDHRIFAPPDFHQIAVARVSFSQYPTSQILVERCRFCASST